MREISRVFIAVAMFLVTICFGIVACNDKPNESARKLRLATTTSAVDSGLLDVLLPVFEARTGIKVEVISSGTGKALGLAREGKADVVLVHAREAEDRFVLDGYGINRRDVMYNDYVLLGPVTDPAGIRGEVTVTEALRKIARSKSPFMSRGDNSGTHMKEKALWALSAETHPGNWYVETGGSMLETLQKASTHNAYVLSDRSAYLANQKLIKLVVLCEGDNLLWNPYGIIAVNPVRVPGVNFEAAMQLVDFVVSAEGQGIIRAFGSDRYGKAIFIPLAVP